MTEPGPSAAKSKPAAARWVTLAVAALVAAAGLAFLALRKPVAPPTAEVAADPLLSAGRPIYLARCASCHGESGGGDGPIAKGLAGPRPRDFAREPWKHGEAAVDALAVVAKGVPETAMPGWASSYSEDELRAVTAYVYHLGRKPVPDALRPQP